MYDYEEYAKDLINKAFADIAIKDLEDAPDAEAE
jgi:hypothetical protein